MPSIEIPPGKAVTADQPGPHRNQQVVTVGTMYLGYAMFMVLRTIPTVAGPAMLDDPALDLDKAALFRIFAMGSLGALIGKLLGGYAADKFGGKPTFAVGLLLSAVFIAIFSASSTVWLFQLMFLLALLAKSFGWPSMAKIIGNWFPSNEYGRVWAIISTSSRAGTIAALFGLGALLAYMSWQPILLISAATGALMVVVFAFVIKERPKDQSVVASDAPDESKAPPHPLDNTTLPQALVRFARSRQFWLINGSLIGLTILWEFLNVVPVYLKESLSLSSAQASMAAAAFPFGSLFAVLAGGYVFDKLSRSTTAWIMGVLLTLATGCIAVFLLMPQLDMTTISKTYLSVVLLIVFGACVSPCYYLPMSVFSIEFGGPHSGFLIALLDAIAYGMSFLFYYYIAAPAIDEGGWNLVLSLLLVISVWSLLTTFLFMRGESLRQKS